MTDTWYHKIERDPMQVDVLKEPTQDRELYYHAALARMDGAAKFVITKDIIDIISAAGFMYNIPLLAKANKLILPFDPLVIEFEPPHRGGRWFICFRQQDEIQRIFTTDILYIQPHNGRTMLISDAGTMVAVMNDAIEAFNVDDKSGGQAAAGALAMAMVTNITKGIVKNKVAPSEKLNKARAKKGKTAIPEYTTMRIGTVYDRDGKPHMWSGNTTGRKLHWRRAHLRQQPHGPGNSLRKEILVEAMIVNYNPGDEVPELPKRKVKL